MDIKKIEKGQKDWVDVINQNFKPFAVKDKNYHPEDVVFINGWKPADDNFLSCWIASYTLLSGRHLNIATFNLKGHTSPGRLDGAIKLPNELSTSRQYNPSSNIYISSDNKTTTGYELSIIPVFTDGTTLGFEMRSPSGAPAHDLMDAQVQGTVMWTD